MLELCNIRLFTPLVRTLYNHFHGIIIHVRTDYTEFSKHSRSNFIVPVTQKYTFCKLVYDPFSRIYENVNYLFVIRFTRIGFIDIIVKRLSCKTQFRSQFIDTRRFTIYTLVTVFQFTYFLLFFTFHEILVYDLSNLNGVL